VDRRRARRVEWASASRGTSCDGRASSGKQAIARSVVLLRMLGVSCQRIGAAAVVVVVVLRRMLGASCQRIGAAAFVLLQMLGVRFDTSQRAAAFVAAGAGAIGPVVVFGARSLRRSATAVTVMIEASLS